MGVVLREKKIGGGGVSFYLDININGKRTYRFLGIKASGNRRSDEFREAKLLAEEARDALQYEITVKKNNLPDGKKRNYDFFAFYAEKTVNMRSPGGYKYVINLLKEYTGYEVLPMSDITKEFLLGFQEFMKKKDLHNNSIYGVLHRFSTFITRAVGAGYMQDNPFHKIPREMRVKLRATAPRFLTEEQVMHLNKHSTGVHDQVRLGFFFGCFSGLRWGDFSRLRWDQITTQMIDKKPVKMLQFQQVKTNFFVYLPLSQAAIDILEERKKKAEKELSSPYVFPYLFEPYPKRNRYSHCADILKVWREKSGISELKFHLGRHTFATTLLSHGADLYTVSKMLGHTEIKNTQKYANVVDRKKVEAATNFPTFNLNGKKPKAAKKKAVKKKAKK
jgi:integrase